MLFYYVNEFIHAFNVFMTLNSEIDLWIWKVLDIDFFLRGMKLIHFFMMIARHLTKLTITSY